MNQEDVEVSLGDKRVELSTFDRYKGRKNETDRLAIVSSALLRGYSHFHNNRRFRCNSTKEKRAICCDQLGEPEQKFGLTLFQYAIDHEGDLIDPNKCSGKIKLWVISEARYEELSQLHKKWPLLDLGFAEKQHDFMVKCTEEQYQKMTFTPCPDAQWKKKESWYKAVKDKEKKAKDRLKLAIGRQMTEMELMEHLGAAIPSQTGGTDKASDLDLSDVLDD